MACGGILFVVCACSFAFSAMASPDVAEFFPSIQGNLTQITWAHAVNNQSYLNSTLYDNNIMMIEADIILGTVDNSTDLIPVMGHPPSNTSDISLTTFLRTIDEFNANVTNTTIRKGVKLDFKSIEVFNQSLNNVREYDQGRYPLWINADIIPGPINATTTPVNASEFLANARQFNNTVLSIGWTTNFGANLTGSYTTDQIDEMLNTIAQNNVTHNITFPVRAGLAAASIPQLQTLLANVSRSTLTLWSSEGDSVNVEELRNLIAQVGIGSVFIDVPEDLLNQLQLDNLPSSSTSLVATLAMTLVTAMALLM